MFILNNASFFLKKEKRAVKILKRHHTSNKKIYFLNFIFKICLKSYLESFRLYYMYSSIDITMEIIYFQDLRI